MKFIAMTVVGAICANLLSFGMAHDQQLKSYRSWLLIAIVSLVVFLESGVPYFFAEHHTPAGYSFLGQIAYTPDQNMYFSFISQARDGQFVLNNKLTDIPNAPVFVNLEFWSVGCIQHITGISENAIYQVWRFMGILLLSLGVFMVANIVLPSRRRVLMAMLVILFTGGFGFIFAFLNSLHLISQYVVQLGIIDMRYGLLPFQQMTTNPHFSLPHGLILIAYSFFLLGEQRGGMKYYLLSGLFFNIIGLVRPYDIIPPVIIFPLFILLAERPFVFDVKIIVKKLLPLFMIIPVFVYNLWLFKFNDIFKYWALQGLNSGSLPAPLWHYLSFGIVGILAIARLAQYKSNPLHKLDRFLVVWFGITFLFIQLGRYIPALGWSPQIGVYLAVPLGLLGCSLQIGKRFSSGFRFYTLAAVITVVVVCSNMSIVAYFTKNFRDASKTDIYFARTEEINAWAWLKANAGQGSVVLATTGTSQRTAKYTHSNVAAAHYSVTPRFAATEATVNNLFAGTSLGLAQKDALTKLNADYIYIGPEERKTHNITTEQSAYLALVYNNAQVAIYKINKSM
jgi:hypothetical protein